MPYDSPLPGVDRVTSLEKELKQTKEVHGKALTKLVKKIKKLEQAKVYHKTEKGKGAKILAEASKERVKTYNRRKRSTDSSKVSTAAGLFGTGEETDEEFARKISNSQEETSLSSSIKEEYDGISEEYEQSIEESRELTKEEFKKMLEIVPVKEIRVEALNSKYPIIVWEILTEESRKYWKIIRVSKITEAYKSFEVSLDLSRLATTLNRLERSYQTGINNSGCSRHMTRNIAYLLDFKEFDGGYVAFRGGAYGGRMTCNGALKTDSLDFKDLPDENQILLKIPRKDNMYSFDMKSIVPKESLICLDAKATLDESMLWHRRLSHINFKNINKLVKDNLVRGLPTKRFENDQTGVACLKGKQHRAS
ncbi:ribonuclease H-like domain-containing protein, partial [Tanacetum coccineum]